ncbi:MAG: MFS transporter [Dehalococcoidia bacterium]|tara:strand:- start:7405 stop:8688 length:1284 start_codon:yes stop_codon:yes gene_type:complete
MQRLYEFLNWKPNTSYYYGWVVVGLTLPATFCATGLAQIAIAGAQDYIYEDMGWSRSSIAFAASAGTWIAGLLAPFIGRITDKYGARYLMVFGLLVAACSFFIISFSHNIVMFYSAYITGRAISGPILINLTPRTIVVNFFRKKRNIILSTTSTFRPISGSIIILMFAAFASINVDWRETYMVLGILTLIIFPFILIFLRNKPEDIGLLPDGILLEPKEESSHSNLLVEDEKSFTLKQATSTKTLWIVTAAMSLGLTGQSSIMFSLVPFFVESGISQTNAAVILSIGSFLALGNIGWGYISTYIGSKNSFIISLIIGTCITYYLLSVNTLPEAYIFIFIWGLTANSAVNMGQMIIAEYFGRKWYGSILGVVAPISTVCLGMGPFLGASIRDLSSSYNPLIYTVIGINITALVLLFTVRKPEYEESTE